MCWLTVHDTVLTQAQADTDARYIPTVIFESIQ